MTEFVSRCSIIDVSPSGNAVNDFSSRKQGILDHPTFPCGGGSRAFAPAQEQKAIKICVDPLAMSLPLLVQKPVNHLRRGRWGELAFSTKNRSRRCPLGLRLRHFGQPQAFSLGYRIRPRWGQENRIQSCRSALRLVRRRELDLFDVAGDLIRLPIQTAGAA